MDRTRYRRGPFVLSAWGLSLTAALATGATVHVSPRGDDAGDGSAERPFVTPDRARDAARKFVGREPVTVVLHGGTYVRAKTLELGPADSGTAEQPVVWEAAANEEVRVSGGPVLPADAFAKVGGDDEKVLARLRPEARGRVMRADLGRFGDDITIAAYPDGFRGVPAVPELFLTTSG
jgi:hypothetical protein